MRDAPQPLYVPALRMKKGELAGLLHLAQDVAGRVLPRLVVPPPEERDDSLQAKLFEVVGEPNIADALVRCWRGRSAFVEATHLLPELGREAVGRWLPSPDHAPAA